MKRLLKSMWIAFSMYSKIPVPYVEWKEKELSYSLCFFPCVGVVIGILSIVWWNIANYFGLQTGGRALISTIIPILLTGGIHMDGYMDTCDALCSYQSKEKRLDILKDPHIGAFAAIHMIAYLFLITAAFYEMTDERSNVMIGLSYCISRAFSALGFLYIKPAKKTGLFYQFANAANRNVVTATMVLWLIMAFVSLFFIHWITAFAVFFVSFGTFLYYIKGLIPKFGGATGDLAGYFLIICERNMILCIIVLSILTKSIG